MSTPVIQVRGLGKCYQLSNSTQRYQTIRDQLRQILNPLNWMKRRSTAKSEFWALKDVSFEVDSAEVVGIVGRNGAGKSTLLKLLSRITEPTEGEAEIVGRVGSLLEVGTGFHPELTGRENVFLNGAILGMSRKEIVRKFDEIVAFAEVDRFIDTPVKHYSSGMYTRLAFAVAAHLEPDILIVDEVLAVGDAAFQKKSLGKMGEVARGGRTVLFVSHNMAAVQSFCKTAILLDQGRVTHTGTAAEIVRTYLHQQQQIGSKFNASGRRSKPQNCEILDACLECNEKPTDTLLFGDIADLLLKIKINERIRFSVELILRQQDGLPVAFAPSGLSQDWEIDEPQGIVTVRCRLPSAKLASGSYSIDLLTAITGLQILDNIESAISFTVDSSAIGDRNWMFAQGRGQGYTVWDVTFYRESGIQSDR